MFPEVEISVLGRINNRLPQNTDSKSLVDVKVNDTTGGSGIGGGGGCSFRCMFSVCLQLDLQGAPTNFWSKDVPD